jgi:hypothetical protein
MIGKSASQLLALLTLAYGEYTMMTQEVGSWKCKEEKQM